MNKKLFIATPAFDGKVNVSYCIALAETAVLCARNHIQVIYQINTSGSLLCAERNRLVDSFMKSDCTHMLCIDSDLGWPPQAVLEMLKKEVDFVVGLYPARGEEKTFLFRPCNNEDGSIVTWPEKNLLKMQYVPAGFMLITREAITKMVESHPETRFEPKDPKFLPGYALFNTMVWEGEFWGEDYIFCRYATEAGLDIWVDPFIQFDHAGIKGMFMELLQNKKPEKTDEKQVS